MQLLTDPPRQTHSRPSLRYWKVGDSGPPVVLIMGFGMMGDVWQPQVDHLRPDHQVVCFDNRGVGGSKTRQRLWTMQHMADDTMRLIDELGFDTVHLAGVSMGGMVAQHVALQHEDRLRSLVLIATHPGPVPGSLPTLLAMRRLFGSMIGSPMQQRHSYRKLLFPDAYVARCDLDVLDSRIDAQFERNARDSSFLGQLIAVGTHYAGKNLRRLQLPTLIIQPQSDEMIPARHSDRIQEYIPHAEMLSIPDGGHGLIFQCKDEVNNALRKHIAQVEVGRRHHGLPTS